MSDESTSSQHIPFKAETRQLLDILVHSLYTEREIFLRELISNASDALTRVDFEILTNRQVNDPQAELAINIRIDEKEKTLTITDTGVGLTEQELIENLGIIAHSGARAFVDATRTTDRKPSEIIGQFGVGFYSAFMVAEWIRVISRSYQTDATAASWFSTGDDTFSVSPAQRATRGTDVIIKIKEDAEEFLQEYRLREIIRHHSDYIPFPITIGDNKEQVNRQTALWRHNPRQVEQKEYEKFYKQLTLDVEAPFQYAHMVVDAPVQMYALLFIPSKAERGLFMLRREDGLKLYARKVLIQEYCKDLLPEYFRFVQGIVDSEDLPLNVSREAVQSTKVMAQLKKLITSKVIDTMVKLAGEKPESYQLFWKEFGRYIKQGLAIEHNEPQNLYPLLRFHTTAFPDQWSSLDAYIQRMKTGQTDVYYILGDDEHSVLYSPHLDMIRKRGLDALILSDPVDAFMLVGLTQYEDHPLVNVAQPELKLPPGEEPPQEEQKQPLPVEAFVSLVERVKKQLAERVSDVRLTDRLLESPARLVDVQGAPGQQFQRVYRMLGEKFEVPKKVLELNPKHPILEKLRDTPADSLIANLVIEQIFEDALLIEGIHPDPVSMIPRIQQIIQEALK